MIEICGNSFAITGTLSGPFSRRCAQRAILARGGKVHKAVKKSTNYLVCADFKSGGRKIDDAEHYDVPMITEREFFEALGIWDCDSDVRMSDIRELVTNDLEELGYVDHLTIRQRYEAGLCPL